jgi:hypothetical protein
MNNKDKIIFYHPSGFYRFPLGLLMDEALKNDGAKVYFITCDGFNLCCKLNPVGNSYMCKLCKWYTRRALKNTCSNIEILSLGDYRNGKEIKQWDFESLTDIKRIKYKNVDIGYSVISSYVNLTRNLAPKINDSSKTYFVQCLNQAANLTDAFEKIINKIGPTKVCVFNGRTDDRPFFRTAINYGIETCVYEVIEDLSNKSYKVVIFVNHLPHDILYNQILVENSWLNSNKKYEEKVDIAHDFFRKKRVGIPTFDRAYTTNQVLGKLPESWNSKKNNIIIFNSSEDEFFSISDEFDKLALFSSQFDGIEKIVRHFHENDLYHFYLRIHPNLSKIRYKYHTSLRELGKKYDNLTVIGADDGISTYSLLDNADKVVSFGSTVGLEATYWGKPVILLSGSLYYYYDISYTPKSEDDLYRLIETHDLPAKRNDMLFKFAYHHSDISNSEPVLKTIIDYSMVKYKIGHLLFSGVKYQKLFGSVFLSAFFVNLIRWLLMKVGRKKIILPIEEE